MTHVDTMERFIQAEARLERVIYIAGALGAQEAPSDEITEFLEEVSKTDVARLFGSLPGSVAEALDRNDIEGLCEWLVQQQLLGFLVQVSTPVMAKHGDGSIFDWGYHRRHWVYAYDFEAALISGFAWVAQQRAAEEAKS